MKFEIDSVLYDKFIEKYKLDNGLAILSSLDDNFRFEHLALFIRLELGGFYVNELSTHLYQLDEVYEIITDFGSKFRETYDTKNSFLSSLDSFCGSFDVKDYGSSYYYPAAIKDEMLRNTINYDLGKYHPEYYDYINGIYNKNILVLGDIYSTGFHKSMEKWFKKCYDINRYIYIDISSL